MVYNDYLATGGTKNCVVELQKMCWLVLKCREFKFLFNDQESSGLMNEYETHQS